jgi:hypothetical protein
MTFLRYAGLITLLFLASCAHPPREGRRASRQAAPSSPRCGEFCETIQSCAAKADHADLGPLLCGIARCETGNKCVGRITSPNGLYRGPFQFVSSTWTSLCYPIFSRKGVRGCSSASAMHDTCCSSICAAEMIATRSNGGLRNWPVCSKKATGRDFASR